MATLTRERWHAKAPKQAHVKVVALVEELWKDDSARRARYQRNLELYEGRKLPGLNPTAYQKSGPLQSDNWDALHWNVTRLLCKTAQAKIAGRQKPKAQFRVTEGDWSTKRRARKLDRFCEAQMSQPYDGHEDVWALMVRTFLDAVVFCPGFIKVSTDYGAGELAIERVLPWEILVDPEEAIRAQPSNLFHRYTWDRDKLESVYPEHKAAIRAAKQSDEDTASRRARVADRVQVYEAWRLPTGKDEDGEPTGGRWVRCIDGATLEDTAWTRTEFPFLGIYWTREMLGFWGTSLPEEVDTIADELNHSVARIQEAEHLTPKGVCIYEEGSVEDEALRSNEDGINIKYKPGSPKPEWISPQAFSASNIEWVRLNWEKVFEVSAISQMAATARKEPGVTAAVAMRTISDQQSELFSVIDRAYQQTFPALCRHMLACTREIANDNPNFTVRWSGKKFLQEISWGDVDLPEDQYVIAVDSVSEMKNTPADRLSLAQEFFTAGILSPDAMVRVSQYLDTPGELAGMNKQRELIGRYIEEWLDATEETMASGEFRYRAPIPIGLNHEDAILQVAEAYLDAQLDGAPDFSCEFFLRFIEECDQHIQKKAQKMAELQAMAQGAAAAPPANMNGAPAPAMGM